MNEKINNIGELINLLHERFDITTPIKCIYIDIYGNEHERPLTKDSIKRKDGVAYLNLSY